MACWNQSNSNSDACLACRKTEKAMKIRLNIRLTVMASWLSESSANVGLCLGFLFLWASCGSSRRPSPSSVTLAPGDGMFSLSPSTLKKTPFVFRHHKMKRDEPRTSCACPLLKGSTHETRAEVNPLLWYLTYFKQMWLFIYICVSQHNCWTTNLMFSLSLWIVCLEFVSTGLVRSLWDPGISDPSWERMIEIHKSSHPTGFWLESLWLYGID